MKKSYIFRCLLFSVAILLTLTGCSNKPKASDVKKNQVVIAIDKTNENKDGLNPIDGASHGTIPLVQSSLVTYDAKMNIHKDLATDYKVSDDGKRWDFVIRKDAKFTDGKSVTAEDVAFTLNKIRTSGSEIDLSLVDKIETQDNHVKVYLKEPQYTFLHTVATIGIVPEHAYSKDYGENPIGSGPYKQVKWNKGEQIILEANKDYYGQKPSIKKVVILFMNEDAAFAAAKAGKVDIASVSATQSKNKIPGMKLRVIKTQDNRGLTMPMTKDTGKKTPDGFPIGNNVTSDIAIRKALDYGIDRKEMADNTVAGYASPAYSENDGLPWNNPNVKIKTNVKKAKEILADAGWKKNSAGILEKNGQKAEFTLYYLSDDSVRQALSMDTANQAERLGIKISVKSANWDKISQIMFANPIMMGWGSSTPQVSYSLFHGKNAYKSDFYNPEGYNNPIVNKYLDQAMQATSEKEANEFFKKSQWDGTNGTSMLGDSPWVYLVNIDHLYFAKDNLNIGTQPKHPHGQGWPLVGNLKEWKWEDAK